MSQTCPNCTASAPDGAAFCGACGSPLQLPDHQRTANEPSPGQSDQTANVSDPTGGTSVTINIPACSDQAPSIDCR